MSMQSVQIAQSEVNPGKNKGTSNDESTMPSKPLMNLSATSVVSNPAGIGPTNGRVQPVVYVKMPQREMLPNVSRPGTLISSLNTKFSTAPSISSPPMLISTSLNSSGPSTLTGSQQSFVTLQGSIRNVSQSGSTASTLSPSHPHIITLPKGSNATLLTNQQFVTLQSPPGTGQVAPGQQQQYVTLQGSLVSKTQGSAAPLNSSQIQPQYVTIRTPVLATSGAKGATSGSQHQFLTIQAPVLQSGSSTAPTFLPVSAVGATPTGTKPTVTYQVLKSSPKTREQHIVYPLPVTNLIPTSQPKMVLTPVSVVPKLPVVQSGTSLTVTSSADIATSAVSFSGGKSIPTAAVVKTSNVSVVAPKVLSNVRGLLHTKPSQPQSLLKEPIQILPSPEVLMPTSQQMKLSSSPLPTAMSVGLPVASNVSNPGFINITIANGLIQQNALKEANNVPVSQSSECTNPGSSETNASPEETKIDKNPTPSTDVTSKTGVTPSSTNELTFSTSSGEAPAEKIKSQTPPDLIKALAEEISINSLLKSNSVHYNDSLNQKNGGESNLSEKTEGDKSIDKIDLARCLDGGLKDCDLSKNNESSTTPRPSSPMNLFCGDDITLVKLSPSEELPVAKFTVKMTDNPDEVKIELVREEESSASNSKEKCDVQPQRTNEQISHSGPHKPLLLKNSSKGSSASKGLQSLIRNPANMQSILVKSSKPAKFKLKSSSILKPKPKIKKEDTDSDVKESQDVSKLSVDTEIKMENLDAPLTPTAFGDFDAIDALEWKNGIGLLPGSNLKFRMNEFGLMEIVSDDDDKSDKDKKEIEKDPSSPGSENLLIDDGSNSSVENKPNKEKKGLDDIFCCEVCRVYGLASEFLNSRFCTQACSALYTVQQAWQYKREQDLRALRLRRKKRRLEQRLAREKEDQDVKDEDSKPDLKKLKLELPEDGSDFENSLDDSRMLEPSTPQFNMSVSQDEDSSLVELVEGSENEKKVRPHKASGNFTWSKYLEMVQARAASVHLFKEPFNKFYKNGFRVGMKLEGIDPFSPSLFCVLSIAEVKGYRIRLHFDGFPDNYDFWVNADSSDIFPARWCERNHHHLTPPKGLTSPFNWTSYLRSCKGIAAPKYLFKQSSTTPAHPFRVGMKLEAVDRKNSSLICVASVADVLDNRFLVHFDSWDEMYDYWVEPSSPYIHPVGWCEKNGVALTPPSHFKDPSHFSWDKYLKETKTVPAPARAFKPRYAREFRRGMRIEAVDKRVPHLVRVATVDDVDKFRIRIRFDGWPDDYSYWIDDDSSDIHYPGWCLETKHPLEPPLSEEDMRVLAKCGIPGCKGEGHIKGPKFSTHNSAQNCPYAPENTRKESFLPDRLSGLNTSSYVEESPLKERRSARSLSKKGCTSSSQGQGDLQKGRSGLSDDDDEDSISKSSLLAAMQQKFQSELERSVIDPGYQIETGAGHSACWAKHSKALQSSYVENATNPNSWSVQDVVDFLSSVSCLEGYGNTFKEQDIDGEALLLLTQNELVSNLSFKLGHAITLYNCIVLLRQKCIE